MKMLTIFLCLLYLFGCKSPEWVNAKPPLCDSLRLDIKANWKYLEEKLYFVTSNSFIKNLNTKYRECLIGKSKEEVKILFGTPTESKEYNNERFKSTLSFATSPHCLTAGNTSCYFYTFYFDTSDNVIDAMDTGITGIRKE